MFNLKSPLAGKVFKKLNHMDKKQAYTYGGIAIVVLVALLTLAAASGSGADDSLDDLSGRGYDLAQMPFVNDEAEQFLLASKYPDMRNNNVNAIYSKEEKAARQAQDAQEEAQEEVKESSDESSSSSSAYTGYRGGGAGGSARTPTQIGSFTPSGSMASASGGNTSATFGGTIKGDFSPFQREDKGKEAPFVDPNNARQALARFNAASRAAARGANKASDSRKALLGSHVDGTGSFNESGVPLAGVGDGVNYSDAETPDLSNLDKTMQDRAADAREKAEKKQLAEEKSLWDMFLEGAIQVGLDLGKQLLGNALNKWGAGIQSNNYAKNIYGASLSDLSSGNSVPSSWSSGTLSNYEQAGYVTRGADNSYTITPDGAAFFRNDSYNHARSQGNWIGNGFLEAPAFSGYGRSSNKDPVKKDGENNKK